MKNLIEELISKSEIDKNLANKLRASLFFVGAILAKMGQVVFWEIGGCKLGERPINYHIKSFETLGAVCNIQEERIFIDGKIRYSRAGCKLHPAGI